jgi:GNAT superfamily N-acetyltransferase
MWSQSGSGEKGELVTIKAQVMKPSDVDWQGTLRANFIDPEENELRVLPGAQLKLVGVQGEKDPVYKPVPGKKTITATQKPPEGLVITAEHDWHECGDDADDCEWNMLVVSAKLNGELVGYAEFIIKNGGLLPNDVSVEPKLRRHGIASAMYEFAEEETGMKTRPHSIQTSDGRKFWTQNPDRKFGAVKIPSLKEVLAWGGNPSLSELTDWTAVSKESIERAGGEETWNTLSENAQEEWENEVGAEHLRRNWEATLQRLRSFQFPLTVYRAIDESLEDIDPNYGYYDSELPLPENTKSYHNTSGVGNCWSDSEDSSYIQTQVSPTAVVLRGEVANSQAVDWLVTAFVNLVAPDELEVRLKTGANVKITGWRHKNETEWRAPSESLQNVTASHKQTPMSDTVFPNEGSDARESFNGEGTNGYVNQPERVDDGNIVTPDIESMLPKYASVLLPTFEEFLDFCADGKPNVIDRLWGEVGSDDPYDNGPAEDVKKKQLVMKFNKAIKKLHKVPFPATVYRKMRLKTPEQLRKHEVGLSWSTSERKAQVIYGDMAPGKDFLYRGEIDEDAVNWMETIYWRMSPMGNDEDELRLFKGAAIRNLSIKSKGSWQPVESQIPIAAALEGDGQSSFFEEVENPHSVQPLRAPDPPPLPLDKTATPAAVALPDSFEQFCKKHGGFLKLFNDIADPSSDWEQYGMYYDNEEQEQFDALPDSEKEEVMQRRAYEDWEYRYDDMRQRHASWNWPLKVWRCITLNSIRQLKTKGVGVFWAYDESAVDWESTIYANLSPALGEEEKEIRLKEGAPVKILRWQDPTNKWHNALPEWKRVTASVEETVTLYHGTCPENGEALCKNGWAPRQSSMGGNMGQPRYLYLSTGKEDALWFAEEKGCSTLVEVKDVPLSYLKVDPEDGTSDTLEEELHSTTGLPGKVVLTRPLPAEHFHVINAKTAGAGDTNVFIPRHRTESPALHRDPLDPALETEQEQWDAALPDHKVGAERHSFAFADDYDIYQNHFDDEMTVAMNVLDEYKRHKNDPSYRMEWEVVPAARLIKIWNDYMKTGFVRDEKGIDMIAGIILTNIAKLNVNTILCGHDSQDPVKYAEEILDEELPEDYFDNDNAFFEDENGSWLISDYALKPLSQYELQLRQAKTSEQKLQIIDRILNIIHQRSDLAGWFVQGGRATLNRLAGTGDSLEPLKPKTKITNPLLKKKTPKPNK